jgi:alpha-D-ribose 1-methylphosphonate 5-triphosphate synthase subunit PhnG
MLQAVDSNPIAARRSWMALLARAPEPLLAEGLQAVPQPAYTWLRRPETGLVMVRGRIGGTGNRFNLGEMTVTRCTLRLANGRSGVAYIQGRSHRRAELAALADALLQSADSCEAVRRAVLEPVERHLAATAAQMARKAQSTRVEFFTVAREAGTGDTDGEDA